MTNEQKAKEIGSYFPAEMSSQAAVNKALPWEDPETDFVYTLSGRAAIALALKDLLQGSSGESGIKVYMPSYCCSSMLQAFLQAGAMIEFYDVSYGKEHGLSLKINPDMDCDVFFAMSYFGIGSQPLDESIRAFSKRNIPVIEDITHRLLSQPHHCPDSDYLVASLRKWFPIASGGFLRKKKGPISKKPLKDSETLVKEKFEAMEQKREYLNGDEKIKKTDFLAGYEGFENRIAQLEEGFLMDRKSMDIIRSLDINHIRERRRTNAAILYQKLIKFRDGGLLQPKLDQSKDCPLFVALMLEPHRRDSLRRHLTEENIYCPVHWPQTDMLKADIQQYELSLICDQRYGEPDMHHMIEEILKWEESLKSDFSERLKND